MAGSSACRIELRSEATGWHKIARQVFARPWRAICPSHDKQRAIFGHESGRYYSRDEKYTSALALLHLAQRGHTKYQLSGEDDVNRSCIDSNLVHGAK